MEEEESEEEMQARVLTLSTQEKFTNQRETGELPYSTRYMLHISSLYFKLSDENEEEGEMLACQLESEEKMVTIAVTIEEELLNRIEASLHLEEELHFITERKTGEMDFL